MPKVALITGAARRVGAVIAEILHSLGYNIVIHYRSSAHDALALCEKLNQQRADSAKTISGDLLDTANLPQLIEQAVQCWNRLDLLINNASSFNATPLGTATEQQWDELFGSNAKAPFFLAQAAAPYLKQTQGSIINIVDIHGQFPLKNYTIYSMAKASLWMMTKSLARELGPDVRVNGVAPGVVLWFEEEIQFKQKVQDQIISRTALKRSGTPDDIAKTVAFLAENASYITGQIIPVDGGRSITI